MSLSAFSLSVTHRVYRYCWTKTRNKKVPKQGGGDKQSIRGRDGNLVKRTKVVGFCIA